MELELRHLRVLCTIADTGSVGRAAVALGASQPATSTQLRRIERHLGAPLFERTATGVAPTCFGVEVLAAARDVLARAGRLGQAQREAESAGDIRRELRLAVADSPVLPGLLARCRQLRPDLRFTVSTVHRTAELVELLEQDGVDAALALDHPGPYHPGLELRPSSAVAHRGIAIEPAFVALPAGHRFGRQTEVALADLAQEAWFLAPDDGVGWPGVFYGACAAAGFAPSAVHRFSGGRLELQELIAAGLGVSVVQATTRPLADVVVRPLAGTPIWLRHVLLWRTAAINGELAETLFGAATAVYRELATASPYFRGWAAQPPRTASPT